MRGAHAAARSFQRSPANPPSSSTRHSKADASIMSATSPDRPPWTCTSCSASARAISPCDRWNSATCHQPWVATMLCVAQVPARSVIQRTPSPGRSVISNTCAITWQARASRGIFFERGRGRLLGLRAVARFLERERMHREHRVMAGQCPSTTPAAPCGCARPCRRRRRSRSRRRARPAGRPRRADTGRGPVRATASRPRSRRTARRGSPRGAAAPDRSPAAPRACARIGPARRTRRGSRPPTRDHALRTCAIRNVGASRSATSSGASASMRQPSAAASARSQASRAAGVAPETAQPRRSNRLMQIPGRAARQRARC